MSLIDTIALPLFVTLFGLAAIIGVICWVVFYLVPKSRELASRREANSDYIKNIKAQNENLLEVYNELLVALPTELPADLTQRLLAAGRTGGINHNRKEINA